MIAVDSSAVIALLRNEREAERFAAIIAGEDACLVSALSLLETSMVLAGRFGTPSDWADLDEMVAELDLQIVPFDQTQADAARHAFLRYGKGRHPASLNMGDCASYALAKSRGLALLFKGDDFTRTDLIAAA